MMISAALSFFVVAPPNWSADWVWGLPLIVLTVLIHVLGLGLINQRMIRVSSGSMGRRRPTAMFVMVMDATTLLATILHGIGREIWGAADPASRRFA